MNKKAKKTKKETNLIGNKRQRSATPKNAYKQNNETDKNNRIKLQNFSEKNYFIENKNKSINILENKITTENKFIKFSASVNAYEYFCEKIEENEQIRDAQILKFENKNILILLCFDKITFYDITESYIFKKIKETPLENIKFPTKFFIIKKDEHYYIIFLSSTTKLLCNFNINEMSFTKKYINETKSELFNYIYINTNKIIFYNYSSIKIYHPLWNKIFDFYHKKNEVIEDHIESCTLLNSNLFAICYPFKIKLYDIYKECFIGDCKTKTDNQNVFLLNNNILVVYSLYQINLYDLDSLSYFQTLNIGNINSQIQKVIKLSDNNLCILFNYFKVAFYDLQKDVIKSVYISSFNKKPKNYFMNDTIIELSNNVLLFYNNTFTLNLYCRKQGKILGNIKEDKNEINSCQLIPVVDFSEKNNKKKKNNNSYVFIRTCKNSFILKSILKKN